MEKENLTHSQYWQKYLPHFSETAWTSCLKTYVNIKAS